MKNAIEMVTYNTEDNNEPLLDRMATYRRQIFACSSTVIGSLSFGVLMEYAADLIIFINEIHTSAVNTAVTFGPVIGAVCGATVMHYFGRKSPLVFSHILSLFGLCFLLINHAMVFFVGFTLIGFAYGFHITTSRVYVVEICGPQLRASIHFFIRIGNALGSILHLLLKMCGMRRIAVILPIVFPAISLLLAFFAPETPYWLTSTRQMRHAAENLYRLRGPAAFNREFDLMVANTECNRGGFWGNIFSAKFSKVFFMLAVLFAVDGGICSSIVTTSAKDAISGTTDKINGRITQMSPYAMSVVSGLLACVLVLKLSRRFLFLMSATGTAASSAAVCAVIWFSNYSKDILIVPLHLCIWFMFMGIRQISWLIAAETFPAAARDIGMGIITVYGLAVEIAVLMGSKFLLQYSKDNGDIMEFGLYAIIVWTGCILAYFIMPETKDKPLQYD